VSEVGEEIAEAMSCDGDSVCTDSSDPQWEDADYPHSHGDPHDSPACHPPLAAAPALPALRAVGGGRHAGREAQTWPSDGGGGGSGGETAAQTAHPAWGDALADRPLAVAPPGAVAALPAHSAAHVPSALALHIHDARRSESSAGRGYCGQLEEAEASLEQEEAEAGYRHHEEEEEEEGYYLPYLGREPPDEAEEDVYAQCGAELHEYRRVAGRYQAQLEVRVTAGTGRGSQGGHRTCAGRTLQR
jgi:hypothetical protein